MNDEEKKEIEEVELYIDNEQIGACETIKISENIAELKNLDYNKDFIAAFAFFFRKKLPPNLVIKDSVDTKRYTLIGCRSLSCRNGYPRVDYYCDLFRLKFEKKEELLEGKQ